LTAEIHLKEVFAAADHPDQTRLRYHLRAAVRSNPLWLANRGVLSMLMKDFLARRPEGSLT
jgi:hypothetical protein